jgi:drug/metabolite transporter (DMT)-like permease
MFVAETRVDSGLMARLDATGPTSTAVFATLFIGKRLTVIHAVAFALGMAGTLLKASPAP